MSYPSPLIYLRYRSASMPSTLLPGNCKPSSMGIQISRVPLFQLNGTPAMEFAVLGKGSHHSPATPPSTPAVGNPWTLQGTEVSVWLDSRSDRTASFNTNGTTSGVRLAFRGDIHEIRPMEAGMNPYHAYLCSARGLLARAERVPVISPIDNSDIARFNINALSTEYEPATGGKTVGQAIQMLLEEYGAAFRLNAAGIGQYTLNTTAQTATLPAQTISDLSYLDLITPFELRVTGDNIVAGITQMLEAYCPNYMMIVLPDGMIRFVDIRQTQVADTNFCTDPVDRLEYVKTTLSSYSRVIVQGGPRISPYYVQWDKSRFATTNPDNSGDAALINGNLTEQFDYTGYNNDQAKTAFKHSDYTPGRLWLSKGSVSFLDSSNATLPSNKVRLIPSTANTVTANQTNLKTWGENHLCIQDDSKQTRRDCRLTIRRKIYRITSQTPLTESLVNVQSGSFLITQNDQTANGSSVVTTAPTVFRTPDRFNNATLYRVAIDYELYGYTPPGAVVWRLFKVGFDPKDADEPATTYKRKLAEVFTEPVQAPRLSNLSANSPSVEVRTSLPMLLAEYQQQVVGQTGTSYSYTHSWIPFRIDKANNLVVLDYPAVRQTSPNGNFSTAINPPWSANQPFKYVPYNIKAVLPVYDGRYEAIYPPDGSTDVALIKSAYNIDRDLTVTLEEWQDGRDQTYAEKYAKEIWDSVKQPQVDGGFVWAGSDWPTWNAYGISTVNNRAVLQAFRAIATPEGSCVYTDEEGTGIEDVNLILTAAQLQFSGGSRPVISAAFTVSKPRLGPHMTDFHSYQERLTENLGSIL
jgi:hypothetical protein